MHSLKSKLLGMYFPGRRWSSDTEDSSQAETLWKVSVSGEGAREHEY